MNPSRTKQKKRLAAIPHVPYWYYLALGAVALAGILGIAISTLHPVSAQGITDAGDYYRGNPDAAVTIIDWGNFG